MNSPPRPASWVTAFAGFATLALALVCILGACVGLVFPYFYFLLLTIPGIACALLALKLTKRTNRAARIVALAIGVAGGSLVFGGGSLYYARYQAEAPSGYVRVNFEEAFRDEGPENISAAVHPLINQTICIKGYAFPPTQNVVTEFVICQSTRPFKLGQVRIILENGKTWHWTNQPVAISGRLVLNPNYRGLLTDGYLVAKYLLIDAEVRPATTPFGLASRPRSSC